MRRVVFAMVCLVVCAPYRNGFGCAYLSNEDICPLAARGVKVSRAAVEAARSVFSNKLASFFQVVLHIPAC